MDPTAVPEPNPMPPVADEPVKEAPDNQVGQVVAVPPPAPKPVINKAQARQDLIVNFMLFGAAIVAVGIIFGLVKLWARRQSEDCENPSMSLSSFRTMYENGELSQEEYEQIRNKMAAKMKGSLGIEPLPDPPDMPNTDVGRNGTPPPPKNEN